MNTSSPSIEQFDVIVIGAGVNGVGIARDAALRGLKVLVLEKNDLCSGTSAWSTRLIHGGLRYLEYAELHLVRESLREREILLRHAPHLVAPMPLSIPLYKGQKRGPFLVGLGMLAYDLLSFDKSLPWHRMRGKDSTRKRYSELLEQGLRGSAMYYDAQVTFAERLVVETALDAVRHGAIIRTYSPVQEILSENGKVVGVKAIDLQTGQELVAKAPIVCNVSGPWVDEVLAKTKAAFPRLMGGTKGSHIVVEPFPGFPDKEPRVGPGGINDGLYVEAGKDARPFFILTWNQQVLIGTTDLRTDEALDDVKATREECQYLLDETNRLFPSAQLTLDKINFTYSGVRPLPNTPEGSTSAITRQHQILHHGDKGGPLSGLYSVVGGKLTTYRSLAEQAVNIFERRLGRKRSRCTTHLRPLPGYSALHREPYLGQLRERHQISAQTAEHLALVYGMRGEELLAGASPDDKQVICSQTGAIAAEVLWAFRHEMATNLCDLVWRRSMVGWRRDQGKDFAEKALAVLQKEFQWSDSRCATEWDQFQKESCRFQVPVV
jgi:glycerol-3-phosphate dehydrogenase